MPKGRTKKEEGSRKKEREEMGKKKKNELAEGPGYLIPAAAGCSFSSISSRIASCGHT
jgi:hypothetical protein